MLELVKFSPFTASMEFMSAGSGAGALALSQLSSGANKYMEDISVYQDSKLGFWQKWESSHGYLPFTIRISLTISAINDRKILGH